MKGRRALYLQGVLQSTPAGSKRRGDMLYSLRIHLLGDAAVYFAQVLTVHYPARNAGTIRGNFALGIYYENPMRDSIMEASI